MAMILISQPDNWARAADTNQMVYKLTSSNITMPNFQFLFQIDVYSETNSITTIGTFLMHPSLNGTVEFNPSAILQNYLSFDLDFSVTKLTEMFQGIKKFRVRCFEYYGTPPVKITTGSFDSNQINVYNGAQQFIPYTYIDLNPKGNERFVMKNTQQGQFLTDSIEYRVDNGDLGFVWCLGTLTGRPTTIRYKIYYYNGPPTEGEITDPPIDKFNYSEQSEVTGKPIYSLDEKKPVPPTFKRQVYTGYTYDNDITFTSNFSYGYYIPVGPYQSFKKSLSAYTETWLYYEVDLLSGSTVLNSQSMRFRRTNLDCRYGQWQVFWLNKHGGFDFFTFDKKNSVQQKVSKDTYRQKLPPDFSTYSAGEKVFNVEAIETIILNSRALTQSESKLIYEMVQSPVVYVVYKYLYNKTETVYGVPYLIDTDSIKYEQKVNDKEIFMSVTIRPANERIIQRN